MPYGQTLKDSATQLLIKYKSGAIVTQLIENTIQVFTWWLDPEREDKTCQAIGATVYMRSRGRDCTPILRDP